MFSVFDFWRFVDYWRFWLNRRLEPSLFIWRPWSLSSIVSSASMNDIVTLSSTKLFQYSKQSDWSTSVPNLWCLLTIPSERQHIFPFFQIFRDLHQIDDRKREMFFEFSEIETMSFKVWTRCRKLGTICTRRIWIVVPSMDPITCWDRILGPVGTRREGPFICSDSWKFVSRWFVFTELNPLFVSHKTKGFLMKAFFSQSFPSFLWQFT